MSTTGHESEAINVQGLKASLQKLKTDHIDGKAGKSTTLAGYGITDAYTKSETYTKTEVNGLVDTPHQEYETVDTYANLPETGSKDTIYRVSNYNGSTSQVDASVYSEYAWDGSQYVFLCVKSQIGEVFDISVYNNNAKYADLTAALGTGGANIPEGLRKGGMSVKFVQSSDNKYVQFRYMSSSTAVADFTNVNNWQGVDDSLKKGSDNFIKNGALTDTILSIGDSIKDFLFTWENGRYRDGVYDADANRFVTTKGIIKGADQQLFFDLIAVSSLYVVEVNSNGDFIRSNTYTSSMTDIGIRLYNNKYYRISAYRGSGTMNSSVMNAEQNSYVKFSFDIFKTIKIDLENKVTKEQGKSLIDSDYAETINYDENPEYIDVLTDSNGKLLIGIKKNGQLVFGTGVPQVIVDYINQKFNDLGLTNYPNIVTFLGDLIYGDKNLQTLLSEISTFSTDIVRNQATYNIEEGYGISTVSNPLLLPLRKGNKLRLRTEGNSMSLYPNGYPLILYYIIDSSNRIRFTHLYDSNWHEYEIPADAIGIGIYLTQGLLQDATITLYLEEYSGDKYEHEKMYSEDSQFNLLPAIPSYYFTNNYLDNKVDVINSAIRNCSTDCDAFIWITDVHWERWANAGYSPSLIKYIIDRTAVSKVLGGGDYLNGYLNDGMDIYDFMNKMRQAIGSDKFYTAYGNHEFIQSDSYKDIFYGLRQRLDDVVYGDANKTYFYHDDNITKTRYIALGSYGYRSPGGSYTSLYDADQLSWFTGTALNVQNGWTIIIFTHSLYAIAGNDYHLEVQITGAQNFIDAIDNYNGNGTIACVLIGHTHVDRIHQNTGGVPYIISACDRYEQNVLNGGYELILPKTLGTKDEQHFEVVVIDHQNRSIKLIAIGSPSLDGRENNIGSEVEVREVTY